MIKKLKELWNAETPIIARFLQLLSGALGASAIAYTQLPDELKTLVPAKLAGGIGIASIIIAFLLQFTKTKGNN